MLLNFSEGEVRLEDAQGTLLLSSDEATKLDGGALTLPPWGAAILNV